MSRGISIHAPRTGSDGAEHYQRHPDRAISIHAPRTGSDENHRRGRTARPHFNPRSPHGERLPPTCARNLWRNFNPRSPHGERQDRAFLNRRIEISIHAPRTGSDDGRGRKKRSKNLISIHAPRTGSDFRRSVKGFPPKYFNPRSQHGERPMGSPENKRKRHFNPRSPHGERREDLSTFDIYSRISIHAPRTGSDFQHLCGFARLCAFQSTLPARGATSRRKPPTTR